MTVSERIRSELENMTRSERSVATFIMGHMNDIAFFTLDEVARRSEVSTTSVLRFCYRLGFEGFKQFQHDLRADLKYKPDLLDKFQRTADNQLENTLLAQTVQQGIMCIQQTFSEVDFEDISYAVEIISKARRVYNFGMRESQALAMYAYSRLLTVREDVFMFQDGYLGNVEAVLSLNENDVFIVYLFHRYTKETLRLLEILKKQRVQVVLITSPPVEAVARYASVIISCRVDANGIKNTALAPVCLADYLCNAVAMADAEKALNRMKLSEALFKESSILED